MTWKKKFLRFLKEEGVYSEWVYNIRKQHPQTDLIFWKFGLKRIFSEKEKCAKAILYPFDWCDTRQGDFFWAALNNKWNDNCS